jgi:hypothetical protein
VSLAVVNLAQRDTVRLITTGRLKDTVLQALAPNYGVLEDLAELESATSGRLRAQESGLSGLRPEELVFGQASHTLINAAFTRTRPGGNRFNDDARGAWYCAFEYETALAEVSYHLTRALADVGRFENVTDYSELFADFIGPFHDLRGLDTVPPCLAPDPITGYPAGQALARELRTAGSNGIVYPSVRRAVGACLVAFHPTLIQNVRQGAIWRLEWQGTSEPVVSKEPH